MSLPDGPNRPATEKLALTRALTAVIVAQVQKRAVIVMISLGSGVAAPPTTSHT
jgi:hypothetical protein